MKMYVLASQDNLFVAGEVLNSIHDISDIEIILDPTAFVHFEDLKNRVKKNIERADVVLAIIDKNFAGDSFLNLKLEWAKTSLQKNDKKVFIPIVYKEVERLPECLAGTGFYELKSLTDCSSVTPYVENELKRAKLIAQRKRHEKNELRKKLSRSLFYKLVLIFDITGILILFLYLKFPSAYDLILAVVGAIGLGIIIVIIFIWALVQGDDESYKEEKEAYSQRLKEAIEPEEIKPKSFEVPQTAEQKPDIDALGLMRINLEDIKEFYTWSQKQARRSFALAAGMCVAGFAMMAVAIILVGLAKVELQAAMIPTIGGVITELIAGTALVVYRNSLKQLNHYHKALHEDERFLSSVNLLGKFSTVEARDEMLREIIRSEIQMNLVGLNEAAKQDKSDDKEKN